jgi:2-dehydro-3-deoxygalactonokinase
VAGEAALVGIDWGTSRFRAFLVDEAGRILDRRASDDGILNVKGGDFASVLSKALGGWRGELPVLMSGMIGSRQGWIEVPYVTAPAAIEDFAAALVPLPRAGRDIRIVPGVETATATMRDVMRGEEVQVFGALVALGIDEGRFLLPGTHSKWVLVEAKRIAGFSTYMTGEIYAACREHTILRRQMRQQNEDDAPAFLRGVREGGRGGGPGALLNRLFGVRTAGLFGEIGEEALASYLSGLLIGAELADAAPKDSRAVKIIGADRLAKLYRSAAEALGIGAEIVDADCIAQGYVAIAGRAELLCV